MDQKYIPYVLGGTLLVFLVVLVVILSHKKRNENNKLNIQADSNIKVDVNNSVALRNSNMAQVSLKKMLSGKQQYIPYGIDDKDKLYYVGNIALSLKRCVHNVSKDSAINDFAFIDIFEDKLEEDLKLVFRGWIISSNLGINNFNHPIYQVILDACQ